MEYKITFQKVIYKIVAMVLWGLTTWLATYEIFLARGIVENLYSRLVIANVLPSTILERLSAVAVGNIASLGMAILAIVIVVGGFDYHWSHAGEQRSFKLFGITFAFQLAFLGLSIIVR
jgi:hypothetical protein